MKLGDLRESGVWKYTYLEDYNRIVGNELEKLRKECAIAKLIKEIAIEEGIMKKPDESQGMPDNNWWWVTLRPKVGDFESFKNHFEKTFLPIMEFDKYRYAFEQKGIDDATSGEGYHVHLIAHMPKYVQFKDLMRKAKSQWAKYLLCKNGTEVPDAFIDISKISSKGMFSNIRSYIEGDKLEKEKLPAVKQDAKWREVVGLKPFYESAGFQDQINPLL